MGYYDSWDRYDNPRKEAIDSIIEESLREQDERDNEIRSDEFYKKLDEF